MHVVTVRFRAKPDHAEAFRAAMIANAAQSLSDEPGCLLFEVCEGQGGIFLYEVYTSEAAFKAHLAAPHYLRFAETTQDWVASKEGETFATLLTGARP